MLVTHRNLTRNYAMISLHVENIENIVDRMKRNICCQENAVGHV